MGVCGRTQKCTNMGKGKSLDKLRWRAEVEVGGSGCGINNDKKYFNKWSQTMCVYPYSYQSSIQGLLRCAVLKSVII